VAVAAGFNLQRSQDRIDGIVYPLCRPGLPPELLFGRWRRPPHRACQEERTRPVVEILRTNDLVLISLIEAILQEEGIAFFIADRHMSAIEGSLGFLPRRILVDSDDVKGARRALINAGLGNELQGVESQND
jgi:hypothetical protein